MYLRNTALSLFAALIFGVSGPVAAGTIDYSFGDILKPIGYYSPPDTWASLSVTSLGGDGLQYQFTLTVDTNFGTLFGPNAYISSALFITESGASPEINIVSGSFFSDGVEGIKATNQGGANFDFGECFGKNGGCGHGGDPGRLQTGESVTWTAQFSLTQGDPFRFGTPAVTLHVADIAGQGSTTSAWYTVSAVPEPEQYAMLLAGLCLIGTFAARRRVRGAPA